MKIKLNPKRPAWSRISPETWSRAQDLRRNLSPAERELWPYLRRRQLGVNFRRQHPVGPYIVDFYSPEARLVVELDGDSHAGRSQAAHDERRTRFLEQEYLRIVRYTNDQIFESLEQVIGELKQIIADQMHRPPIFPPVNGGENELAKHD